MQDIKTVVGGKKLFNECLPAYLPTSTQKTGRQVDMESVDLINVCSHRVEAAF